MSHEPKFCVLCGFMDDGTSKANALSVNGRCPFCEQAYRRGREDAAKAIESNWEGWDFLILKENAVAAARGDGEQA